MKDRRNSYQRKHVLEAKIQRNPSLVLIVPEDFDLKCESRSSFQVGGTKFWVQIWLNQRQKHLVHGIFTEFLTKMHLYERG